MKRTFKLISIALSIIMICMSCSFSSFAKEEVNIYVTNRFGDLDSNSHVNSADARLCLRAAADLETLTGIAMNTADIDGDGEVTSADARKILRAASKIEVLNAKVPVFCKVGSTVVIDGLKTAGSGYYVWNCTAENENAVKIISYAAAPLADKSDDVIDGSPVQEYFEITIAETGSYNVKFELKNSNNEVIDEFSFDIACYYTGEKL